MLGLLVWEELRLCLLLPAVLVLHVVVAESLRDVLLVHHLLISHLKLWDQVLMRLHCGGMGVPKLVLVAHNTLEGVLLD